MITNIIKQSGESQNIKTYNVSGLYGVGDYQFISPAMLWHNNATYIGGNESNATNNIIKLFKYNHSTGVFQTQNVGSGTDTQDAFDHPRTSLHITSGGVIYAVQSNPHNGVMDVWKSDVAEDITGGFTELSNIPGSNAYPQGFTDINNQWTYVIRTGSTAPDFNLAINQSATDIEGTYTLTQITGNTDSGMRYYNESPLIYGTPTKHYVVGNMRAQTGSIVFGQVLLVTTDWDTFSNYQNTASKDVTVATLSTTELETDYTINGSTSAQNIDVGYMNSIQIDDVFYGITVKSGTSDFYIYKVDGTSLTTTQVPISNIDASNVHKPYLYYNGQNIVITCNRDFTTSWTREIWACDTALTTFKQKLVKRTNQLFGEPIKLPDNLDEVEGEYALVYNFIGPAGIQLLMTTDKFLV